MTVAWEHGGQRQRARTWLSGVARDEASVEGEDDGLDTVTAAELCEHSTNMRFDGGFAQGEHLSDLGIRHAVSDEAQDVAFAFGEPA
jgi:hypothetical protein